MSVGIIDVKLIKREELKDRKTKLIKSQLFNKLNVYLTKHFNKTLENLSSKGIVFGTDLDSSLFRVQFFEDHDVFVNLLVTTVNRANEESEIYVRLNVVEEGDENTILWDLLYNVNKDEFDLQEKEYFQKPVYDVWESIVDSSDTDIKEMTTESFVKPRAFGDFCMPGKYQYCGKECGKRGKYGGGKIKNNIDGCCFIHDECYFKNKTNRCINCDIDLMTCVTNPKNYKKAPATAAAIYSYFNNKCLRFI